MNVKYTKFMLLLMLRKPSIYIMAILYWGASLALMVIVPIIFKTNPMNIMSYYAYMPMYLMIFCAMLSAVYAIQLFRTNIDDGTEILIISKPITRREILVSKFTIFITTILFVAVAEALFTLFANFNPLATPADISTLSLGSFVATIIDSFVFGSISIITSIYIRKIGSLLISIGLAFVLMLISSLASIVTTTPMKFIQDQGMVVSGATLVKVNDGGGVNMTNGAYIMPPPTEKQEDINDLWKDAFQKSAYPNYVNFDFAYQLSTIYNMGRMPTDVEVALTTMAYMNEPYNINFSDKGAEDYLITIPNPKEPTKSLELSLASTGGSDIRIGAKDIVAHTEPETMKNYKGNIKDFWTFNTKAIIFIHNHPNDKNLGNSLMQDFFNKNLINENHGIKKENYSDETIFNTLNKWNQTLLDIATYFETTSEKDIVNDINNGKFGNSASEAKTTLTTYLSILNYLNPSMRSSGTINAYDVIKINGQNARVTPLFNILPEALLSTYKQLTLEPLIDISTIIGVWATISVVIMGLAVIAYSRRDFA